MPGRKAAHSEPIPWAEAVALVGSEVPIIAGVKPKTVEGWRRGSVPAYRVLRCLRDNLKLRPVMQRVAESLRPYDGRDWLNPEWQKTHTFTALVMALQRLERIDPRSPAAWKTRVAWETIIGPAEFVLKIAGWGDQNWKEIYDKKLDHWRRPRFGKRAEQETLREAFMVDLGAGWEDTMERDE